MPDTMTFEEAGRVAPETLSFESASGGTEEKPLDQIGNILQPEGHVEDPIAAREGILHESNPYAWARIRQTPFMRKLLGPTDEEKSAIENGTLAGPPGGDVGVVPLAATLAPLAAGGMGEYGVQVPLMTGRAGQALMGYYIARNIASQPDRVSSIIQKFKDGDAKGAWHDVLGDTLDTGMAGLSAVSLASEAQGAYRRANPPRSEPNFETMRRAGPTPTGQPAEEGAPVLTYEEATREPAPTPAPATPEEVAAAAPAEPVPVAPPEPGEAAIAETPPEAVEPPPEAVTTAPTEPPSQIVKAPNDPLDLNSLGSPGTPEEQIAGWKNVVKEATAKIAEKQATLAQLTDPSTRASLEHVIRLHQQDVDIATRRIAELQAAAAPHGKPEPVTPAASPALRPPEPAFQQKLFQGRGATLEEIYGKESVAQGRAAPLFGVGDYYAFDPEVAKQFGKVTSHDVALQNPFMLDSDAKWFQLLKDADAPHLNNMGEEFYKEPQKVPAAGEKVQAYLKAKGYDGIVVRLSHGDDSTRRLAAMAGDDQVVKFNQPKAPKAPKSKPKKPVETPPQAAAKVEEHVEEVAKTEGQRPAKEVKSELVDRLEKAIDAAPSEKDLAFNPTKGELAAARERQSSITIKIPGDGTFTIKNTKEALGEVLSRAARLATHSGKPAGVPLQAVKNSSEAIKKMEGENERIREAKAELEAQKKGKVARDSRSRARKPSTVSTPAAVASQPAKSVAPVQQFVAANARSVIAPQTLGNDARDVANALRHFMGQNAMGAARADAALAPYRAEFEKTPVPLHYVYDPAQPLPHNYAVIDALERDRTKLPPRYQKLAAIFDKEFARRIVQIRKYNPNALQNLLQNYFPHVWQDPRRASEVMAQIATRLFAGRKEFLKQRSLAFFQEGIAAGLKPISDNPVDMLMAKMHSMDKYLLALRFFKEFRGSGVLKFKYLFDAMPDGHEKIEDPSFIVQKPPVVTVDEAYDQFQRAKLMEIFKHLGITHTRLASLGGAWADAAWPSREIRSKVGAHEPTLWHELGHQIDWVFPQLRGALQMRGSGTIARQLRKIADLRAEGQQVTSSHQAYLRSTPEKMAEIFRLYVYNPKLFRQVAPGVLDIVDKFLDTEPFIRDRLQAMRGGRTAMGVETTEIKLGGMQQLGHWVLPTGAARVVKNYLSPGLARYGAYRAFRSASNILNSAQLGLSGFHVGFTSLDAAVSRLAVGLEDAARGNLGRAAKTIASVPVSPATNFLQGNKMIREALHPGSTDADTAALVRALEHAGGRIGQDAFWKTNFTRRMLRYMRYFRQSLNDWDLVHAGKAGLIASTNAPLAVVEQAMRPIMEYIVPRQKLGVFADMARRELERLGPNATTEETREAMRKAWDSVDNRMGQMVYDNLFYHRAVKDAALLTFRAYGWQLGKYREGLGALYDAAQAAKKTATGKRPEVSHRMAYAAALVMLTGLLGAILTRLMTGRNPKGQDYFMPPTGDTDGNGNAVRLNFPSYMKDVLAYQRHPVTSLAHSLNPMYSGMFDLLENKDFYNVEIRHPDDPLWKQGGEVAAFAAKQFEPFSVSGIKKLREDNSPVLTQVAPFFGFTPVPSRMTMTPAQELASDLMAQGMGDAPLTQEQFDKSKIIRDAVRSMKSGKGDGMKTFGEAMASGKLNPDAMQGLMDRLKYTPLQFQVFHLPAKDAMKVWRIASPQERADLQAIMVQRVLNSKALNLGEKQGFLGELAK